MSSFSLRTWSDPFRERATWCSCAIRPELLPQLTTGAQLLLPYVPYKKQISFPSAVQLHPINIFTVRIQTLQMLPHRHETQTNPSNQTPDPCILDVEWIRPSKITRKLTCTPSLGQRTSINATDASLPQRSNNCTTFSNDSGSKTTLDFRSPATVFYI